MESWESFLYTVFVVLELGCRGLAATLALRYRKLWKATSRHWGRTFFVVLFRTVGLWFNLDELGRLESERAVSPAGLWAPSFPRPSSGLSTSRFMWISAHHLHLHTQISLRSTQRVLAFFFFVLQKHLISTCTVSYNHIQYWRYFQLWS